MDRFLYEFADKLLLEYKDNRKELISKIQKVYADLNMSLPKLDGDGEGNVLIPKDMDPFSVFTLFN